MWVVSPKHAGKRKPAGKPSPKNFHIDKRAAMISAADAGDDDELLTTKQVAQLLGVSEAWLKKRRADGTGPPYEKISTRCVRYPRNGLRPWREERDRVARRAAEQRARRTRHRAEIMA
jgi:predicted DNA-binding transcriptional regulator AlpA